MEHATTSREGFLTSHNVPSRKPAGIKGAENSLTLPALKHAVCTTVLTSRYGVSVSRVAPSDRKANANHYDRWLFHQRATAPNYFNERSRLFESQNSGMSYYCLLSLLSLSLSLCVLNFARS